MLNSEPVSTVEGKWCGNTCCVEYFGLKAFMGFAIDRLAKVLYILTSEEVAFPMNCICGDRKKPHNL